MTEPNDGEVKDEETCSRPAAEESRHGDAQTDFRRAFSKMFEPPAAAGEHFHQARVEFLKGVRELIDHRIEKLSRTAQKG